MFAQVAYASGADERDRVLREQHLPAMAGCPDPRGPMDIRADVALVGQQRHPGVDAHTDMDGSSG